ncbi:MAG TPA: ribonuclease P protein component [Candidatus Paceibacterota bacterium]
MLPKKYRLPIQGVVGRKSRFTKKSDIFLLKFFNSTLPHCRFGIIVSKQVAAKAVERNQIKRSIFQALQTYITMIPSMDVLIIVSSAIKRVPKAEIILQLEQCFKNV